MNQATAKDNNPPNVMRRGCSSTLDRITSLPDSITGCILSLLPLREAARTSSVLSSSWRNKWRYIPELLFDSVFYESRSNKRKVNKHKLIWHDIFRILSLYCGPLTGFKFCIYKLENCPEVERLFLFLCGKNVQEFRFHIGRKYRLPSHLFAYDNLRKLASSHCVFKTPPSFRGFHRLCHVDFSGVSFEGEDLHRTFISYSPLLEHLFMDRCTGISYFAIDFPNLKFLRLEYCSITSFGFRRSPLLETVEFIHYLRTGEPQIIEVSWIMCLIMSSPNLKFLKMKVCCTQCVPHSKPEFCGLFQYGEVSDYCAEELTRVEIEYFSSSLPELEFVNFLLSKSPSLEVLIMKYPINISSTKQVITLKEMIKFPSFSKS